MDNKNSITERLTEITDGIEKGIRELFESKKYQQYLRTMSTFHHYSFNNTMLIFLQKPNATLVAGFHKWQDQFERHVKKGEKGIKIIAPTPFKTMQEREKLDPATKRPMLDASGKVMTERVEVEIPMFKPVTVFDVSQTEGKPLPSIASTLTGNVSEFEVFMEALSRTAPVPIQIEPMIANTDGYFSIKDQRIAIREGMSEVQTVSAAIHEITHSLLHNKKREETEQPSEQQLIKKRDRRTEEVEAESVSYAVCAYYGIETEENSFGYIASWSKDKELPELRASLELINQTAGELIADIDQHLVEIRRDREHELSADDILASQQDHKLGYVYLKDIASNTLSGLDVRDNPLRSLEDSMEQSDSQLDGMFNNLPPQVSERTSVQIQNIRCHEMAHTENEEQEKQKKSVRDQLINTAKAKKISEGRRERNETIQL